MPGRTVRLSESAAVLTVVLNRPDRQNSITSALLADLHGALDWAEQSPTCRLVVIKGEAGIFSMGMDLAEAGTAGSGADELAENGARKFLGLLRRLTTIGRIVVSQVDGTAAGGGVGIAAASDFVYATPRSRFSLPEALWGLLPCCVLPFLIRRVGFQKAYAMTLGTHPVDAEQAARSGLVDEVTDDPDTVLRRLLMRASRIDGATVADAKRYFDKLWIISEQTEAAAVREFGRLMSSAPVRRRIADFAAHRKFPWES